MPSEAGAASSCRDDYKYLSKESGQEKSTDESLLCQLLNQI